MLKMLNFREERQKTSCLLNISGRTMYARLECSYRGGKFKPSPYSLTLNIFIQDIFVRQILYIGYMLTNYILHFGKHVSE